MSGFPTVGSNPTLSANIYFLDFEHEGVDINMKLHFKILGSFWLVWGGIATVNQVVRLWQTWRTQDLPASDLIDPLLVFVFVLCGAAVLNGWGLLSRKRWTRPVTIALSFLYLFTSPLILVTNLLSAGWLYGVLPLLTIVLVFMMGLYGLWLMLSKRGEEAFRVYVS